MIKIGLDCNLTEHKSPKVLNFRETTKVLVFVGGKLHNTGKGRMDAVTIGAPRLAHCILYSDTKIRREVRVRK